MSTSCMISQNNYYFSIHLQIKTWNSVELNCFQLIVVLNGRGTFQIVLKDQIIYFAIKSIVFLSYVIIGLGGCQCDRNTIIFLPHLRTILIFYEGHHRISLFSMIILLSFLMFLLKNTQSLYVIIINKSEHNFIIR